jgi:hypothetical protein
LNGLRLLARIPTVRVDPDGSMMLRTPQAKTFPS